MGRCYSDVVWWVAVTVRPGRLSVGADHAAGHHHGGQAGPPHRLGDGVAVSKLTGRDTSSVLPGTVWAVSVPNTAWGREGVGFTPSLYRESMIVEARPRCPWLGPKADPSGKLLGPGQDSFGARLGPMEGRLPRHSFLGHVPGHRLQNLNDSFSIRRSQIDIRRDLSSLMSISTALQKLFRKNGGGGPPRRWWMNVFTDCWLGSSCFNVRVGGCCSWWVQYICTACCSANVMFILSTYCIRAIHVFAMLSVTSTIGL